MSDDDLHEWRETPNRNGEAVLTKAKKPDWRSCWVGAPEAFLLDQACAFINDAFGQTCYLVGSATQKRDFRDVDVRLIMGDDQWTKLFGPAPHGQHAAIWSLLCSAISEWASKRTGLKVDFQVQRRSSVTPADWAKPRCPLGLFYGKQEPEWHGNWTPDGGQSA